MAYGVVCAWLLVACGGTVSTGGGGADGGASGAGGPSAGAAGTWAHGGSPGSAGGTAFGGSGAAAAAGTTGIMGCVVGGRAYADGEKVPSNDDCNSCFCSHGDVICTDEACLNRCEAAQQTYAQALEQAKRCDPSRPNQCTAQAAEGLACGCPTFVNPLQRDAVTTLKTAQQQYSEASCNLNINCGPCPPPPTQSVCSAQGRCEDAGVMGAAACKVGGKVYPSGASGIPDPTSCNKCSCENGQLSCTEIYCPIACPPNSVPSTQCAACGPTDGCDVVEFGCLPVCTDSCASGACVNGVCRSICG